MPSARKVVTRSPKRNVGLVNCPWFQDYPIEHESRLEKHFVLRAILFPGLKTIQHQPFKMDLDLNGKSYTPDFLLRFGNGDGLVVEVKRAERVKELKERLNEIASKCARNKLQFFVVHQGQIEGERRAARAALIRRYAMHRCGPSVTRLVTDYVYQHKRGVTIRNVKKNWMSH